MTGYLKFVLCCVLLLILALALLAGCGDLKPVGPSSTDGGSSSGKDSARPLQVGDVGAIAKETLVASTPADFDRMMQLCVAGDGEGLARMALVGRVASVTAGIRCRKIQAGSMFSGCSEVRFLDGPLAGEAWWVLGEALTLSAQDAERAALEKAANAPQDAERAALVKAANAPGAKLTHPYGEQVFYDTAVQISPKPSTEDAERSALQMPALPREVDRLLRKAEAVYKAAEEAERIKKERQEAMTKWRTWTDSTGEHKIEAKYQGVAFGKVKLVKRDGSTIQLPLEKLCDEDQKWIKEKKWNR